MGNTNQTDICYVRHSEFVVVVVVDVCARVSAVLSRQGHPGPLMRALNIALGIAVHRSASRTPGLHVVTIFGARIAK